MSDMNEVFGEPISVYTSDQAVEDGVLVEAWPERWPKLLLTRSLYEALREVGYERVPDARAEDLEVLAFNQVATPFVMDVLMILKARFDKNPGEEKEESRWFLGGGETKGPMEGNATGKEVWVARNDVGGITIMFPEDD